MNAFARFPAHLHWTAQQLADAVPMRLHELFAFDAARAELRAAANTPRATPRRDGYLHRAPVFQRFHVR